MADQEPPTAVRRARRAKGDGEPPRRLDGGAVAVGLLCALLGIVPATVVSVPFWTAGLLAGAGLVVGGFAAASITPREGCAVCHAGVVGVSFYTVVAALAATTYLAPEPSVSATVLAALGTDLRVVLGVAVAGIALTAIGGYLGTDEAA